MNIYGVFFTTLIYLLLINYKINASYVGVINEDELEIYENTLKCYYCKAVAYELLNAFYKYEKRLSRELHDYEIVDIFDKVTQPSTFSSYGLDEENDKLLVGPAFRRSNPYGRKSELLSLHVPIKLSMIASEFSNYDDSVNDVNIYNYLKRYDYDITRLESVLCYDFSYEPTQRCITPD